MSSTFLQIGIIGFGKIGRLRMEVVNRLGYGNIVSICDPKLPEEQASDIIYSDNPKDVLGSKIDTVFIATPNHITADLVIDSLKQGLHVFCEKPPGRNLQDVLRIKEEADKHPDLRLKFGFNHRYHYSVMHAYDVFKKAQLGELMWARGTYGKSGGSGFASEWRSDKAIAGGGILLDQGIHMVDLLNLFFGGFDEVKSFVSNTYWDIPVEDNAFALLKNKRNKYAMFHSTSTQWKHIFRLELFFTDGYMIIPGFLTSSYSYGREKLIIARRQFEDEIEVLGNPLEEEIYFDKDRSWEFEVTDFYKAIESDLSIKNGTLDDAIKAMEIVDKIYNSDSSWAERSRTHSTLEQQ